MMRGAKRLVVHFSLLAVAFAGLVDSLSAFPLSEQARLPEIRDAVAIDGDTLVLGRGIDDSYCAVYVRHGRTWSLQAQLRGDRAEFHGSSFGSSVDIDGDTLIVGASSETNIPGDLYAGHGAVYIFNRDGNRWTKPVRYPGGYGNLLGSEVAISGESS